MVTPPASKVAPLVGTRALVIDDNDDARELTTLVLEQAGASVVSVASAREALALDEPFDVIICDIAMPEIDGFAFMATARDHPGMSQVPVLALSVLETLEMREQAYACGFEDYVTRPIVAEQLVLAVQRLLDVERPSTVRRRTVSPGNGER